MKKILYIDAGHGGLDVNGNYTTPSTIGKFFDHKEAATFHKGGIFYEGVWNRSFAQKFIYLATQAGYHCVPVYDTVRDTRLGTRVEIANNYWEKVAERTGVYLSFHSNAFRSVNRGFHLFHHPASRTGKAMGEAIVNDINKIFTENGSISFNPLREGWLDLSKRQIYYVLEATSMPALLFEFGFFDNLEDAKLIFQEQFQCDLALQVIKALDKVKI